MIAPDSQGKVRDIYDLGDRLLLKQAILKSDDHSCNHSIKLQKITIVAP